MAREPLGSGAVSSPAAPSPWPPALAITVLVGVVSWAAVQTAASGEIWAGLAPADCAEYCEGSHRCGPLAERPAIQQPLNTVSNLAYLLLGLVVGLRRRDLPGVAFAAAMALLCLGSGFFHASMTRPGQWLDVVGMYVVSNVLVGFALHAAGVVSFSRSLPVFLALDVLLGVFKWSVPATPILGIQGSILIAVLVRAARAGRLGWRWVVGPPVLFLLAYGARELDVRRIGCDPEGWRYQGHALWHLLAAFYLSVSFEALARSGREERR